MYYHYLLPAIGAGILLAWSSINQAEQKFCRCRPTDSCWPNKEEWTALNNSIEGNLVYLRPVGSVCHEPTFLTHDSGWRASQPGSLHIAFYFAIIFVDIANT
jgi:hypothetical protein